MSHDTGIVEVVQWADESVQHDQHNVGTLLGLLDLSGQRWTKDT